jgi:hypothetical protein
VQIFELEFGDGAFGQVQVKLGKRYRTNAVMLNFLVEKES